MAFNLLASCAVMLLILSIASATSSSSTTKKTTILPISDLSPAKSASVVYYRTADSDYVYNTVWVVPATPTQKKPSVIFNTTADIIEIAVDIQSKSLYYWSNEAIWRYGWSDESTVQIATGFYTRALRVVYADVATATGPTLVVAVCQSDIDESASMMMKMKKRNIAAKRDSCSGNILGYTINLDVEGDGSGKVGPLEPSFSVDLASTNIDLLYDFAVSIEQRNITIAVVGRHLNQSTDTVDAKLWVWQSSGGQLRAITGLTTTLLTNISTVQGVAIVPAAGIYTLIESADETQSILVRATLDSEGLKVWSPATAVLDSAHTRDSTLRADPFGQPQLYLPVGGDGSPKIVSAALSVSDYNSLKLGPTLATPNTRIFDLVVA